MYITIQSLNLLCFLSKFCRIPMTVIINLEHKALFIIKRRISHCCIIGAGYLNYKINQRRWCSEYKNPKHHEIRSNKIWTIPNSISLFRIISAPLLAYLIETGNDVGAIIGVGCLGVTDLLDGWIARRFKQESALGSILDPLGDKILAAVLTFSLYDVGKLPLWLLLLIVGRDAFLIGMASTTRWKLLKKYKVNITFRSFFDPNILTPTLMPVMISKINTALQMLVLGLSIVPLDSSFFTGYLLPFLRITLAGSTIGSTISYAINWNRTYRYAHRYRYKD